MMSDFGKTLIVFGIVLIFLGAAIMFFSRHSLPVLPGDIMIRKKNFVFYFPIASAILISIILTIIFNLIFRK